jgi:hypothetical protein
MSNPNLVRKPATSVVVGESSFNQIAAAIGGGSGGSGGKNYIQNPNFNGNSTANWNMRKVTLSSFIPTGNLSTAADAGHTISVSGSSTLEGAYSLLVQGSSLFTAGNCLVSDAFTIDREDLAKVLGWSFSYEAVTSNMDFSGTTSNTWAVYIAEVSAASGAGADTVTSWIQPAGVYNMTQGTGVGLASGTFQTTAAGLYYRLVLVCINSEAATTTLKVDDFQLGPQKVVYGSPVTDWQSYTPSITWSNCTSTGRWRRVGDSIEVRFAVTGTGLAAGGILAIGIPSGLSVDDTKLPANAQFSIGEFYIEDFGVLGYAPGGVLYNGPSSNTVVLAYSIAPANASNVPSVAATVTNIAPFAFNTNDVIRGGFRLPIAGLSSSVQMSNDTDTRVVAAKIRHTGTQACPAFGPISFNTTVFDTHSAWNNPTNAYIIPVSGVWEISFYGNSTGSPFGAATQSHPVYLLRNSVIFDLISAYVASQAGTTYEVFSGSAIGRFNAGDSLQIAAANNGVVFSFDNLRVEFRRLSGPSAIAASETVAASYQTTAGQSIPNNTSTFVNFLNSGRYFDTHGMITEGTGYNSVTGAYTVEPRVTVPVSGKYLISHTAMYDASAVGLRATGIRVNGATILQPARNSADGGFLSQNGIGLLNLNAGDYVQFTVFQSSGANLLLTNVAGQNYFTIQRVGN